MELMYVKGETKSLREFGYDEKWLQKQVLEDPSILGLGDLTVIERERVQPRGGRIDFLMADPAEEEPRNYYEVELMLGQLDPNHIIRAIEYWDVERIRFPKRNHCAVIIAEEITSRFFNVISLLNRAIPIIAIQLDAMRVTDKLVLKFTKVLDVTDLSEDDEEPVSNQEKVDAAYWDQRSPAMVSIVKQILSILPFPSSYLTYNSSQVALATTGRQFAWFNPRKNAPHCFTELRINAEERDQWVAALTEKGISAKPRGQRSMTLQATTLQIKENSELIGKIFGRCEAISR